MLRISVEYDVRMTAQNGTVKHTTTQRGWFPAGDEITDAMRARVLREAAEAIQGLDGFYTGWQCLHSNPRILHEFND
jgi:hypothetical protein